jgi:hypothetical protein
MCTKAPITSTVTTLTTGSITGGSPSGTSTHASTFNFAGGTLIPTAGTTTFMQGLTTAQGLLVVSNNGEH